MTAVLRRWKGHNHCPTELAQNHLHVMITRVPRAVHYNAAEDATMMLKASLSHHRDSKNG